jgi:acetyl-CoA synthetase
MSQSFESLSTENRQFPPAKEFSEQANIKSAAELKKLSQHAEQDWEGFWKEQATNLKWDKPFDSVVKGEVPFPTWFNGGKLNASVQCLDKHRGTDNWEKLALVWEGEDGVIVRLTYRQLFELTCQTANQLKAMGIKAGDVVTLYMPVTPEAVATMLACARLGAAHSVVFAGFSSEALKERINDAKSVLVVTGI